MDGFSEFMSWLSSTLKSLLGPWAEPPLAALTVFFLAVLIPLISSLSLRLLVDIERYKRLQRELRRLQSEFMKAKDKKSQERIMMKMRRIQKETSKPMMINMLITWPAFLIIYWAFYGVFGNDPVAYMPLLNMKLQFIWWYFLCAMGMGVVINKALDLTPP